MGFDSFGDILLQKDHKNSLMRSVYFASRVMKVAKKKYSPMEKIVLALMFATENF